MGILSNTVIKENGMAIGVIPKFLKDRELANPNLTKLEVVESMIERKEKMFQLAVAFIALPGGPGTLEEITEMVSWSRIGQNPNPCVFFNVNNFYDAVELMYNNMVSNAFLTVEDRNKLCFSDSINEIEDFITHYEPPMIRQY